MITHRNSLIKSILERTNRSKLAITTMIKRLIIIINRDEQAYRKLGVKIMRSRARLAAARDALDVLD